MSRKDEDASGTSPRRSSSTSSEDTPIASADTAAKKPDTEGTSFPRTEKPPQSHATAPTDAPQTTTASTTSDTETSPKHSSVENIVLETAQEAPKTESTAESNSEAPLPQHVLLKPSASQKQPNFLRQTLQKYPQSDEDYSSSSSSARKSSPDNASKQKDAQPASSSTKEDTQGSDPSVEAFQLQSKKKRFRRSYNCGPCKTHKIKCDMRIPCGNCEKYDRRDECLKDPPNPPTYQQYLIKQERKRKYLEKRYHLVSSRQDQTAQEPSKGEAADFTAKHTHLSPPQKLQYELTSKPYNDVLQQPSNTISPKPSVNRSESFKYSQPLSNSYGEHDYRVNTNPLIDYKNYYQGAGVPTSTNVHQNTPQIPIFQQQHQQQQQQMQQQQPQQQPPQNPAYAYYPDLAAHYPPQVQMMAPQSYGSHPQIPPQTRFSERAFQPSSTVPQYMEAPYVPLLQPILQPSSYETLPPVPQYPSLPQHVRLPAISEPQHVASVSHVPGLPPPPMMVSNQMHEQYGFRLPIQVPSYPGQPLVAGREQYHAPFPGQEQAPPWASNPSNAYMPNTKTLVPRAYGQSNGGGNATFRLPNMDNIAEEQVSSYRRPPIQQLPNQAVTRSTETNSNLSNFDGSQKLTSLSSVSSLADRFAFTSGAKQQKSTRQ
ncbi:hypothetical protein PICMEDRAFT_15434 [Pichia membranifaciens NRRL Y-2026]|uniref:Zn(2)-C6 fungal-type domain-containing protein n=1 Tax=Pichia membranifaciens NRRL Y-2026 TaxID=763406 RepID=A0A1E3NN01_9ASCO|nr:hypothetical protein PICMEDRAFT_15434 [Pichia membranifaciens NRRL Y-2026]ODQ47494.1 hypothetical protein PICMEDRAFT_15434 [Pichia membranifaciens NRRL Y-2026]